MQIVVVVFIANDGVVAVADVIAVIVMAVVGESDDGGGDGGDISGRVRSRALSLCLYELAQLILRGKYKSNSPNCARNWGHRPLTAPSFFFNNTYSFSEEIMPSPGGEPRAGSAPLMMNVPEPITRQETPLMTMPIEQNHGTNLASVLPGPAPKPFPIVPQPS